MLIIRDKSDEEQEQPCSAWHRGYSILSTVNVEAGCPVL